MQLFGSLFFGSLLVFARGHIDLKTNWSPSIEIRADHTLVTDGIYHYIRHPLYSSLFFLTWGIFFKALTWPGLLLALAATLLLVATARADEAECLIFFGEPYQDYMKRSKRFVPFLF